MDLKHLLLFLAGSFVLVSVLLLVAAAGTGSKPSFVSNCLAVIDVKGEISVQGAGGGFSSEGASSDEIVRQIEAASGDTSVSAIFLDIDSPGGSAVASKDIYDSLVEYKKPIVAYIGEVGASGGYYAASAADRIFANPNAITGSIGARASLLNYEGLFGKLGLREESVKSGALKDMGSGTRNLTDEERALFSEMINETFEGFEADVRKARAGKLSPLFESVIDGRILTAKRALDAGLIDEIGSKKAALRSAAALANLSVKEGELPEVCSFARAQGLRELFSSLASESAKEFSAALGLRLPSSAAKVRLEYS